MENKLTDNEIIKALGCCIDNDRLKSCKELVCPFAKHCKKDVDALEKACLDLINRQKAEIIELQLKIKSCISEKDDLNIELQTIKAENERLTEKLEASGDPLESAQYEIAELKEENQELHKICERAIKTYKETKSEAIKEFAEGLKERAIYIPPIGDRYGVDVVFIEDIDFLVKEMVKNDG